MYDSVTKTYKVFNYTCLLAYTSNKASLSLFSVISFTNSVWDSSMRSLLLLSTTNIIAKKIVHLRLHTHFKWWYPKAGMPFFNVTESLCSCRRLTNSSTRETSPDRNIGTGFIRLSPCHPFVLNFIQILYMLSWLHV